MKNMPSIETQHEMIRFLMKAVIPRMIEENRRNQVEKEKEEVAQ